MKRTRNFFILPTSVSVSILLERDHVQELLQSSRYKDLGAVIVEHLGVGPRDQHMIDKVLNERLTTEAVELVLPRSNPERNLLRFEVPLERLREFEAMLNSLPGAVIAINLKPKKAKKKVAEVA